MEKYDYLNRKAPHLIKIILFEIVSFCGRVLKKKKNRIIPFRNGKTYCDLGFGANYTKGWINADFYVFPRLKFWKASTIPNKPDVELDFRYPILCENNCIDGIYSGHTLEHLYPAEAFAFLKEIYRILKPGAWLRINVPDLGKYIEYYNGRKVDDVFNNSYETGSEAISSITQDWGHHSLWDSHLLKRTLEGIGFINVREVKYGEEGTDANLIKEEPVRAWETLVIECQK